jgi:hypothetical protein
MSALLTTFARTTAHVGHARDLCREMPVIFAETASLIQRSRDLCLAHPRMAGGSDLDSPSIVEIISRTPMCIDCLSSKMGITPERAAEAVDHARAYLQVTAGDGRCERCLQITTVYALTANGAVTSLPSVRQHDVVWGFLQSHRGQMHCTQCIAKALTSTQRIDRAILAAEGRGARRLYGLCVVCGRERLLCGLTR